MTDIYELFQKDPLNLTNSDIDQIIHKLRESRHQFNAGNLQAGKTKPLTEKQKQAKEIASRSKLSINDLL